MQKNNLLIYLSKSKYEFQHCWSRIRFPYDRFHQTKMTNLLFAAHICKQTITLFCRARTFGNEMHLIFYHLVLYLITRFGIKRDCINVNRPIQQHMQCMFISRYIQAVKHPTVSNYLFRMIYTKDWVVPRWVRGI